MARSGGGVALRRGGACCSIIMAAAYGVMSSLYRRLVGVTTPYRAAAIRRRGVWRRQRRVARALYLTNLKNGIINQQWRRHRYGVKA